MNLQRFIDAKQAELQALRAHMPQPLVTPRPDFFPPCANRFPPDMFCG